MVHSIGTSAVPGAEGAPSIEQEMASRPREEQMMLLGGFLIGLTIAGFFLLYIVVAIAFGDQASRALGLTGLF